MIILPAIVKRYVRFALGASLSLFVIFGIHSLLSAQFSPLPRFDTSHLDGAGTPAYTHAVEPTFGERLFRKATLGMTYESEGEPWYLIAGQTGDLWSFPQDKPNSYPVFSLRSHLRVHPLPGQLANPRVELFGAVFGRDYPISADLYLIANIGLKSGRTNHLLRFEVAGDRPLALKQNVQTILTWPSDGHSGSDLHWGPHDGMLYITAGDRSAPGDPNNVGQRTDGIYGSVLRIDLHEGCPPGEPYGIPPDNPFVGVENVRPEIFAYGLRNPWRMTFHPKSHEIWLGDNGEENWDHVRRIRSGDNGGWSTFEGSHAFRSSSPLAGPNPTLTVPLVEHPHNEMRSIIGGYFYEGQTLPELQNHYLYGCYVTKKIWAVSYDVESDQCGTPFRVADTAGTIVSIRPDHDGEPLIACYDGKFFRLIPQTAPPTEKPWPTLLSELGLFESTASHQPAAGVHPYTIVAEAWADGATAQRLVALPRGGQAFKQTRGLRYYKSLDMPEGTLFAKTLSLGDRRIETQILFYDLGLRGYTYKWDEDQKDAALVAEAGEDVELSLPNGSTQPWRFASRAECSTCHTQQTNFAIGFTTPQLDSGDQIRRWISGGLLTGNRPLQDRRAETCVAPHDLAAPLEDRARSYLDINCAHCHYENGLGGRASFQLIKRLPLEEISLINATPTIPLLGKSDAKIIAPGHPELSELLGRMIRTDPSRMPLIGNQLTDPEGINLIRDWIQRLPAK